MDRVLITDSVEAAAAHIEGFWRNYDSLRWVGDLLVLRLKHTPTDAELASLNREFAGLLMTGQIEASAPLPAEIADHDRVELPRIALHLNQYRVGELYQLIRAVNALGSAQA
jgi:hypothetical protein